VFADCRVEAGARVDWAILDERSVVSKDAVVGGTDARGTDDPEQVTIVGRDSVVTGRVAVGSRLEPGTTGS
jgi:glucose-1-phosphate adenylyltransferase